jgi:Protein of unknown function (DUF1779).
LYAAAVLWAAVATQLIINHLFREDIQITEAFVKSDTEDMQSSLEIAAEYKGDFLSEESKKNIIYDLADSIGLVIDNDITVLEDKNRSECSYFKQAKKASTELKVVSVEQKENATAKVKNYIIVRLNVKEGIQSIDKFKVLLEKSLDSIGVKNQQVTMKYEGNRNGNLTASKKQEIARKLVKDLQGEVALEYDEGDLYTVYAYTGMLKEYVQSLGNKINIQIAITYNELTNMTKITLATPMLNESW